MVKERGGTRRHWQSESEVDLHVLRCLSSVSGFPAAHGGKGGAGMECLPGAPGPSRRNVSVYSPKLKTTPR